MPTAREKADEPLPPTTGSRIADPEGKHLEVCRIQLAAVVEQRDACREWVEWCCREWEHRRHQDWPPALLSAAHALKIISENGAAQPPETTP